MPTLDYRTAASASPSPGTKWRGDAVVAFGLATMIGSFVLFGLTDWVRLARPGSRLFGPQDQYVQLARTINAWISGIGMCGVGGGIFLATLVASGARGEPSGAWACAASLGLLYVAVFVVVVRLAEHLAGSNVGGPTSVEYAAHIIAGMSYPILAGFAISRVVELRG